MENELTAEIYDPPSASTIDSLDSFDANFHFALLCKKFFLSPRAFLIRRWQARYCCNAPFRIQCKERGAKHERLVTVDEPAAVRFVVLCCVDEEEPLFGGLSC